MKNVKRFLCVFGLFLCATGAHALELYVGEGEIYTDNITIDSESEYTEIVNHGTITGTINVASGVTISISNYGVISGGITCETCALISQIITGSDNMNQIPGLVGHTVVVNNDAEISLVDILGIAGNAAEIQLKKSGVVIDVGAVGVHPNIVLNTTDAVNFIVRGLDENWNEAEPILTGIYNLDTLHDVQFDGLDSMFVGEYDVSGRELYVSLGRQTNYGIVFENELGDYLDDLRDDNPGDKLLDALDAARTRAGLRDILSRSVRTNPINLMKPVRSFNSFVLGEYFHDLSFGIVAEPFYIYSSDFSVIGGGVGLSGTIAKNLIGKLGFYAGKMNYDSDLDDFGSMIYGANFGALYKDSSFYARVNGTVSSAKFNNIDVFDGICSVSNPNGISGAMALDGGLVFRVWDEFDLTPFVGARFDYAHVLNFTDTDTNLRFGLNIDKETVVDGNRYAFGVQAVGQTNGEIYGAIYTDIMSVVDGVGGRLSFGILNDDFEMSYKISLDAKFAF